MIKEGEKKVKVNEKGNCNEVKVNKIWVGMKGVVNERRSTYATISKRINVNKS